MPNVILIADDDENDLKAIRDTLKEAGARNPVKMVDDGDKVIAYLKGEGKFENREKYPIPAILFLDLKMRRVDGFHGDGLDTKHAVQRHSNRRIERPRRLGKHPPGLCIGRAIFSHQAMRSRRRDEPYDSLSDVLGNRCLAEALRRSRNQ